MGGWDLSWLPMRDIKNASPVETVEYAVAAKTDQEPAFKWWVSKTLKKRWAIVTKVKSRYWRTSHKFGVKLPHSVEEAYKLDEKIGDDYWHKAIEKEMSCIHVAFEKWVDGTTQEEAKQKLIGYQEVRCHMIFNVKMSGLIRKVRLVTGGHMADTPGSITYSRVVSRDSVCIAFLVATLNDLDVMSADIGIWTVVGHEFGTDKGAVFVIS